MRKIIYFEENTDMGQAQRLSKKTLIIFLCTVLLFLSYPFSPIPVSTVQAEETPKFKTATVRAKLGFTSSTDRYAEDWGGGNFVKRADGKLLVTYNGGEAAEKIYLSVVEDEDILLNNDNIVAEKEWLFYTRYSTIAGNRDNTKLLRTNDGKILLFIMERGIDTDPSKPFKVIVFLSNNGLGTDFEKLVEFHTTDLSTADGTSLYELNLGLPLQLDSGRIVVPLNLPYLYLGYYYDFPAVAYSDDNGVSWIISRVSSNYTVYPIKTIGILGNQLVLLATYSQGYLYFLKSDDWGATWKAHDTHYSPSSSDAYESMVSVGNDGNTYLGWTDSLGRYTVYKRSIDQPLPSGSAAYDLTTTWTRVTDQYYGDDRRETLFQSPEGYITFFGTSSYSSGSIVHAFALPKENHHTVATYGSFYNDNKVGESVEVATGNYSYSNTDISVPTRGLPLEFTRYYNSKNKGTSPLGIGWSHSYSSYLRFNTDASVDVIHPDGKQVRYESTSTGYVSLAGFYEKLVKNTDGTYTLSFEDESQYHYDANGKLIRQVDKNGNSLTLAYDGSGNLSTVKDDSGRSLSLSYNAGGLLSGITDPISRTIAFEYDTSNQLTGAKNRRGIYTFYTYDSKGMTSIKDGNGNTFLTNVYDSESRILYQYDASGDKTSFSYNDDRRITTVKDRNGNSTPYTYSKYFRVTEDTNPLGQTTGYSYDENMNRTAVTDPLGNTTKFSYDSEGNMLSTTDAAAQQTKYSYDSMGNMIRMEDANGKVTEYSYDLKGNLVQEVKWFTNGEQATTSYSYDSYGQLLSVTDANLHMTKYTYDEHGNLIKEEDPLGNITTYSYDLAGRKVSEITPRGNVVGANPDSFKHSYEYDLEDNLLSVTDPLLNKTTYSYDGNNNKISENDALNRTTSFNYDKDNRVISQTDALGYVTQYEYDDNGNLIKTTDARGNVTRQVFDEMDRLVAVVDPLLNAQAKAFDANGNVSSVTDAVYNEVSVGPDYVTDVYIVHQTELYYDFFYVDAFYDGKWNQVFKGSGTASKWFALPQAVTEIRTRLTTNGSTISGFGGDVPEVKVQSKSRSIETDSTLYIAATTNNQNTTSPSWLPPEAVTITPTGPATIKYAYDTLNRKIKETDALGREKAYTYDAIGNVLSVTEATYTTKYLYDDLYRLVQVTDAKNQPTGYTYDKVGNLLEVTNAKGNKTSYQYNALGKTVQEVDPLGNAWTFSYDAESNLVGSTDAKGQMTSYTYDPLNRVDSIAYHDTTSVKYTYNAVGQRTSMTDPTGTTSYEYDALNRMIKIIQPGNKTINYAYDAVGNKTSVTAPNTRTVNYQYDNTNRLVATVDWNGKATQFEYDKAGRKTKEILPNGVESLFAYNAVGELVDMTHQKGMNILVSRSYEYDSIGNRTSVTDESGNITSYEYDVLEQLTKESYADGTSTNYTYDDVGNRSSKATSDQIFEYSYDVSDRLTVIESVYYSSTGERTVTDSVYTSFDPNGNMLKKGDTSYSYDPSNRLIEITMPNGTARYIYNGDGDRVSKDVNGNITNYVNDLSSGLPQLLMETDGAGNPTNHYIDGQVVFDSAGNEQYNLVDGIGSVIAITNAVGDIIARYDYDAFGNIKSQTGSASHSLKFTGEQNDPESGLVYLRARYYDPSIGRFVTKDSYMGQGTTPLSQNRYIYVSNNPLKYVDPTGYAQECVGGICSGEKGYWDLFIEGASELTNGNNWRKSWEAVKRNLPTGAKIYVKYQVGEEYYYALVDSKLSSKDAAAVVLLLINNYAYGGGKGKVSSYKDITKGNSIPNRSTSVTKEQFERNLINDGWKKSTSKDGKAIILTKNGKRYILREKAESYPGWTADYSPNSSSTTLKIRLGGE
jgi:RHS repeat-associated protein